MNKIKAHITKIENVDTLNLLTFDVQGQQMQMMALEIENTLAVGSEVTLGVKATNVALAMVKSDTLSIENQLEVKLVSIERGQLLSNVCFEFNSATWESVVTTASMEKMTLTVSQNVIALVKASDLSIVGNA